MSEPYLFFSQRLDVLYQTLSKLLFREGSSPFLRRVIIVPSQAIKSWLFMRMASDKEIGIAAGVDVLYLSHMLRKMDEQNYASPRKKTQKTQAPSHELSLFLEVCIREMFKSRQNLPVEQQKQWQVLWNHLKVDDQDQWSRRSERRLLDLCSKLPQLFSEYSLHDRDMIESWKDQTTLGWQEQLYLKAFAKNSPYISSGDELHQMFEIGTENMEIHVFGSGLISQMQHQFFCQLSRKIPIYYYLLSPCQHFWTDFKSDRERRNIRLFLKKQGSVEEEQEHLDEYMQDNHPLLANMGRVGRECFAMLEQGENEYTGLYPLPQWVEKLPQYQEYLQEELYIEHSHASPNMLEVLKTDMLLLRKPEKDEPITFSTEDNSIQIHQASSRLRETQIIYNQIMGMIADYQNDENPIKPSDILVMMPEPKEYEACIRTVFGDDASQLAFRMLDVPFVRRSLLWKGFSQLIEMCSGRWDVSSLLQLFEFPAFQRRHRINMDDVESLRVWIDDTGIRWGFDQEQRDEALKRDHCQNEMVDRSGRATWAKGIERLLLGLSMICDDEDNEEIQAMQTLPSHQIDFLHSEFLSKVLEIMSSLKRDLMPLSNNTEMTMEAWGAYLQCILEAYFTAESNDEDDDYRILFNQMGYLGNISDPIKDKTFTFPSAMKMLEALLGKESMGGFDGQHHAIRFASLIAMRTLPYRVIVLMGMQDGKFPRPQDHTALNLLQGRKTESYIPQISDEDRYLFLESIFAAEECLILSYHATPLDDPQDVQPSLAVTELLSYLDRAYAYEGGQKISEIVQIIHPALPFDRRYFDPEFPRLRSFLQGQNKACQAMEEDKCQQKAFLTQLFQKTRKSTSEVVHTSPSTIDIKELTQSLRDPLKYYCQSTFGIYLDEDEGLKNEEDFTISPLNCAIMRRRLLRQDRSDLMAIEELKGKLPLGLFGDVAWSRVHDEVLSWRMNLNDFAVSPNEIFDIELSLQCQEANYITKDCLQVPAPTCVVDRDNIVKITGRIQHVSPQGLIVFGRGKLDDTIKNWAQYLALSSLRKDGIINTSQNMLWVEIGKIFENEWEDSEMIFQHLIRYHLKCRHSPSPLLPTMIESIWKANEDETRDKMRQQKGGLWTNYAHNYLDWVRRGEDTPFLNENVNAWKKGSQSLFDPILEAWFPKLYSQSGAAS
ncbi:hypothetical protein SCG7109_AQ_00050 [Chlamydiales bacterium SCGC AG-110-M15]|nr:hypothetical protein SCG7109_AQ_00050 [Chlamydiales bacterium SCGC AG-110-M15]